MQQISWILIEGQFINCNFLQSLKHLILCSVLDIKNLLIVVLVLRLNNDRNYLKKENRTLSSIFLSGYLNLYNVINLNYLRTL